MGGTMRAKSILAGLSCCILFGLSAAVPSTAAPRGTHTLPTSIDADGDGWIDPVETTLGSDPNDATSRPESIAVPDTCFDRKDNDKDTKKDSADPGCTPPALSMVTFPPAGTDAMDSVMDLNGYIMQTPFGDCPVDFIGRGPIVV